MSDSDAERRAQIAEYFVDENVHGEPAVVVSPSGRFRLTIRTYHTAPGRWNYTRGTVTRVADSKVIADIQRNYAGFHYSFVTKDEREYLITGRSYMSQTIVDLDRGQEFEPPGEQYGGGAFCWARCFLSPDGNTLAVDGCIWACPYEYRFFDFTEPSRGWASLPISGIERVEDPSDKRAPQWLDASTFECFQCDANGEPQERTRLQRRGAEMVVTEHWVSDTEQSRRDAEARAEAEQDAWWHQFSASDPMYLRLVERVTACRLPYDNFDWQPGGRTITLYFRRLFEPPASADLVWDTVARTLRVELYGPTRRQESFDHSIAGIDQAVALVAESFGQRSPQT